VLNSDSADLPSIVRNARYEREMAAIEADEKEKAQAEHALDFGLARDPQRGFPLPGSPYRIFPIYVEGMEYIVYYRVAGMRIYLDSIRQGVCP
jgi:hypothetical protein